MPPKIAVVDSNMLTCIGLADLLEIIMPGVSVRTFRGVEELKQTALDDFIHFFVSAQVYIQNTTFFRAQKHRAIVLTNGDNLPQLDNAISLNVCQPETALIRDIMALRKRRPQAHSTDDSAKKLLSTREIEVLALIAKGYMNKEIGDELCISLTTVISHRKRVMEKLGIRTVSGLTIYALLNGYVQIGDLQNPNK
ncbi:MAG: response regulator transcription factor [Bacteroidaceae bacterium]|nr:response regulator transcription factor [Bacteroidaceae bacterium]